MVQSKLRKYLAAAFLSASSTLALVSGANAAKYDYDRGIIDVERGDIPQDFEDHFRTLGVNVPYREILRENGIRNPRKIATGAQLSIPKKYMSALQAAVKPQAAETVIAEASPQKYDFTRGTIQFEEGDTLWGIEQHLKHEYGVYVPYREMQHASKIRNVRKIENGAVLAIPEKYLPALQAALKTKTGNQNDVGESEAAQWTAGAAGTVIEEAVPPQINITTVKTRVVNGSVVLIKTDRSPIDLKITDPELAQKISAAITREHEINEDVDRMQADLLAARLELQNAEFASMQAAQELERIREESKGAMEEYVSLTFPKDTKENGGTLTPEQVERITELHKTVTLVFKAAIANDIAQKALVDAGDKLLSAEVMLEDVEGIKQRFLQETQNLMLEDPNLVDDINARLRQRDAIHVAGIPAPAKDEKNVYGTLAPVVVPMVDVETDADEIPARKVTTISIKASSYAEIPPVTGAAAAVESMANGDIMPPGTARPKNGEGLKDFAARFNMCQMDAIRMNRQLADDYRGGRPVMMLRGETYNVGGTRKVVSEADCAATPDYRTGRKKEILSTGMAAPDVLGFNDAAQGSAAPCNTVYSKADPLDSNKVVLTRGCYGAPSRFIG